MVFSCFVQNRSNCPLRRGQPKNMEKTPKNRTIRRFYKTHSSRIMFYDQTDIGNGFFIIKLTLEHLDMSIASHKMSYRKTKSETTILHA